MATFTTYELVVYSRFIFYTVLSSMLTLNRTQLKAKVNTAPTLHPRTASHLHTCLRRTSGCGKSRHSLCYSRRSKPPRLSECTVSLQLPGILRVVRYEFFGSSPVPSFTTAVFQSESRIKFCATATCRATPGGTFVRSACVLTSSF